MDSILITNAQLRGRKTGDFVEIQIEGGKIATIGKSGRGKAEVEIDAGGNLVTESFVNPHLHLDKVYTLDRMDELALQSYQGEGMGKAMNAIELASRVKAEYDASWILPNVRKALTLAAQNGNTHIRAFADVDSKAQLVGVKALIQAREEFKGVVDLQVVAFAQDGLAREPGAEELVREAMKLGADVVGGIPWIEFTDKDVQQHVDVIFNIAKEFDKPVSMLVDDAGDAGLRSLEMMAVRTIEQGWQGRSLAHHARAMALYPKPYLQKVIALLKQAEMYVVTDPQTGPLHARVRELLEEGAFVCLGQDDISDAYYPYGQNNMLEVAFLASHLLWMTSWADMETLYDMVTTEAAKAMGLGNFAIKEGAMANLVVLDAPNVREALRYHHAPVHVVSHGRLVEK
ncbi:MAG: cytosine deaminase [Chloroflexi bacterium]|nr:amidohydrolase family protein [Chloroflexota bacterium]MQC26719.1 cytosine deaminase [Chloroflexota bacterium]